MADYDEFKKRLGDSAGRLADKPFWGVPATGVKVARDVMTGPRTDAAEPGGIGDLSTKTQIALRQSDLNPGGEQLRPLDAPMPDVQAAPSLKDQLLGKLRGNVGGGGNGLGGLEASYWSARKKQVGDYDRDKELADDMGEYKAQHATTLADWQHADAAMKERHAQLQMDAEDTAHQETQRVLTQNMQRADDIGKQKIDPKRLANSQGTGDRIMHILGGALGGALAARTGGPNQFLERFDKEVSQDIQSQLDEIDNKKASLGARQNIVAQMIHETGDRRSGVMAARNLMYEAAKQHLAATDAQLGVPEIKVGAQQNVAALQHQQDGMSAQISAEVLQQKRAQAQAAAAARAHAEQQAWQRQKDVFEMGLKKDQLDVERIKAGKDAGKEDNAAIAETTKRLADDDIVKNRDLINSLSRKVDKDGNVVGLGFDAKLRSAGAQALLGPASALLPNSVGDRVGMSDEERIANQEFKQAALLYQTKVTGSGGSDPQMQKIGEAFKGAGTMAEKRRAIGMLKSELDRREGTAMANLSDSQKVELNRRLAREGQTDMPKSVKVTDGSVSDERAKQFKKKLGGY